MRLSMILGAATVLTLSAIPASAQFTGVVVPPPAKAAPVAKAQAQAQTLAERRDSAARVSMTNMKDWVDSAAATLGVTVAPVDSVRVELNAPAAAHAAAHTPAPGTPARPSETTEFREGARAPDTATPIPMIALAGLVSLIAGLVLLRPRRA